MPFGLCKSNGQPAYATRSQNSSGSCGVCNDNNQPATHTRQSQGSWSSIHCLSERAATAHATMIKSEATAVYLGVWVGHDVVLIHYIPNQYTAKNCSVWRKCRKRCSAQSKTHCPTKRRPSRLHATLPNHVSPMLVLSGCSPLPGDNPTNNDGARVIRMEECNPLHCIALSTTTPVLEVVPNAEQVSQRFLGHVFTVRDRVVRPTYFVPPVPVRSRPAHRAVSKLRRVIPAFPFPPRRRTISKHPTPRALQQSTWEKVSGVFVFALRPSLIATRLFCTIYCTWLVTRIRTHLLAQNGGRNWIGFPVSSACAHSNQSRSAQHNAGSTCIMHSSKQLHAPCSPRMNLPSHDPQREKVFAKKPLPVGMHVVQAQ